MSDIKDTKLETVYLLPNQLTIDAKYDVRPFEKYATEEHKQHSLGELRLLASSIEASGQLDPVCITPERVLVYGHRRRSAVVLLNERQTALGQSLTKLWCKVDPSGTDLDIKAFANNFQRKGQSSMDLAYYLHNFRKQRDLLEHKGIAITSRLLQVSRFKISQSEILMKLTKELQNYVHEGQLSVSTALLLMQHNIPIESQIKVFERGREIQQENHTARIMHNVDKKYTSPGRAALELAKVDEPKRVEYAAVLQSMQEFKAAKAPPVTRHAPLSHAAFLEGLAAADTPGLCKPARKLIRYLINEYAAGKSTQEELSRQLLLACGGDNLLASANVPLSIAACN